MGADTNRRMARPRQLPDNTGMLVEGSSGIADRRPRHLPKTHAIGLRAVPMSIGVADPWAGVFRSMPEKVFAYITSSAGLLILRHPHHPEAGLQVPAGTVEPGESLEAAVMREAREETGLSGLKVVRYLGDTVFDASPWGGAPAQRRHFFHLRLLSDAPTRWLHNETDGGNTAPILFELYWALLPGGLPPLIAGHDEMLPALLASCGDNTAYA